MKYFKKLSVFLAITLVICGFGLPSYADSNDVLKETDSLIQSGLEDIEINAIYIDASGKTNDNNITPFLNYEDVKIKNGQRAVFTNDGDYFEIEKGVEVSLHWNNSPSARLEVGFMDSRGNTTVHFTSEKPIVGSGATMTMPKTGKYKFYIKNLSSDPTTITRASVTF
ncbi:hypothetical protein KQI42_01715 [Tissierella sp. MSJ-40]|uniref:Uncharacterized protein n=1 Tax=Tissierella simiarum TaxID=2841534 RepID=A0ABS6E378_9FIRM|nr:hypothetical protein [Tissierella simiarum]MBU5436703.1 hypothetical protein [Tissierella simiarum]